MDLTGKIKIDAVETEFLLTDEGSFMQWGGTREELGPRVSLLEKLGAAYLEWRQETICCECGERPASENDPFGQERLCDECINEGSCPAYCSPEDPEMAGLVCSECGTDWGMYQGGDWEVFRKNSKTTPEEAPNVG